MLYFFHHYELPVILQQAHFQQFILRNTQQQLREQRPTQQPPSTHPLTLRLTQLLSAVRPSATTQTSTSVAQVATSTSTTTTSTVGTSAQPVTSSQTSQTTPAAVESAAAQTPPEAQTAAAASQTVDLQARPTGGPDQPWTRVDATVYSSREGLFIPVEVSKLEFVTEFHVSLLVLWF